jgi:hypothetical protein
VFRQGTRCVRAWARAASTGECALFRQGNADGCETQTKTDAMSEGGGTRGYLTGDVDVALEKLRAYLAREPDRRRLSVGDVVRRMETEIDAMKKRGFSAAEIVAAIGECGVKISVNALASQWSALQKEKGPHKARVTVRPARHGARTTKRQGAAAGPTVSLATPAMSGGPREPPSANRRSPDEGGAAKGGAT